MLLDPDSLELVPAIAAVLAASAGGELEGRLTSELMQSVVELRTSVCASVAEAGAELGRLRAAVVELGEVNGFRVASAGTHPFSLFERQLVTDQERYRAMVEEFQLVARQQLIFGLHVHVAVADPETAIQVVEGLLVHVPELLALSASSPYWRGADTGLASSRQTVFATLPRTGLPPRLESFAHYAALVGGLERSGTVADYTRIWWDVRPHPRLGTVELRICDAVTLVEDAVALAAYGQALVKLLGEQAASGVGVARADRMLAAENKWLAARHGLAAVFVDLESAGGGRLPAPESVRRTLERLGPHARELGCERELALVEDILARGNGAECQRRIRREGADERELVRRLADATAATAAARR